ncbi:MAG: heavy metal translocating P-type ATPase metal-binding domain-containing protein [Chitinophagales bacterium]|nr:heavy metal translocating P-type ATPase metal-binding domain-containing protein [Chitinophagales bacterium]MDW8418997.1 heavy metal translocating P-type ATPase metal-binding domain-containing protein [Chitinophagales bacterium]
MYEVGTLQDTRCYHCGDKCVEIVRAHDHNFCCEGCKTVYEILNENGLCSYYNYNEAPGTSRKDHTAQSHRYAYLDDESVLQKLIHFTNSEISIVTLYLPQIHCSSCIYLLENLYRLLPGVIRSVVHFGRREVTITFQHNKVTLRQIVEMLSRVGYEPVIQLSDLGEKVQSNLLRSYLLKIGVAFFAFGNIMLLSFPEYLGIDVLADSPMRKFFGYLNFTLSLPVLFYSSSEFFISAWGGLRQRILNMDFPIVLGIIVMFLRSTYDVFWLHGGGYFDTMASLVLLMLTGRLFQNKTYDNLSFERDYRSYFPVSVTVMENGEEKTIPLTRLKTGQRLLVRNMELIPADSLLVKGSANIDYSFVTGEATPVSRRIGEIIYAGGKQVGSAIEVEVLKDVSHSYLTQLWNDSVFTKSQDNTVSTMANRVSRWFTPLVLSIAFAAAAYWWNTDREKAINAFTSVLIITCPCALALSSPFTFGNILRLFARYGIYLKNAIVIEILARINAIVFDKTGTLTYTKTSRVEFIPDGKDAHPLTDYEKQLVRSLTYHSSHPLSKRIYDYLAGVKTIPTQHFKEEEGKGIEGWIDEHCVRIGSKKYLYGDNYPGVSPASDFRHASKVYVGIDGKVLGYYLVKNEYRPGFENLIGALRRYFNVYVVSGDNDAERNFLSKYFDASNLYFGQQPADKLAVVRQLRESGKTVMMLGDGLNDAGALKQADVGIVISDDVNNFSPACDGIIQASQFRNIMYVIEVSRRAVSIVKVSFAISLLYNVVGLYFAVKGTMSPLVAAVLMPLSSVTIILFTTFGSAFWAFRNWPREDFDKRATPDKNQFPDPLRSSPKTEV